jgi:hypothetical protein
MARKSAAKLIDHVRVGADGSMPLKTFTIFVASTGASA